MARYTGPLCKQCRREGQKLFLKGERCFTGKCSIDKRGYAPGQHGQARKKLSEYGLQLREKQKARRFYGVSEVQFRGYFEDAERMKGVTGENLLRLLELRLDNVVHRLGFARSRSEARQLVRHGHFLVDGKKVNIPSYELKVGQVIEVKEKSKTSDIFKVITDTTAATVPSWLSSSKENLQGKVVALPTREEIDLEVKENSIVELYSK